MLMNRKQNKMRRKGIALMLSMIFIAIFSSLSIALLTMSTTNAQVATNHSSINAAMNAALSGMEIGKFIISQTPTITTTKNTVSDPEANTIWANLCSQVQTASGSTGIGGLTVQDADRLDTGDGDYIETGPIAYGSDGQAVSVRFFRYDSDPRTICMSSCGIDGNISRKVSLGVEIKKESKVLDFAIASRGRMWVTQNSVIHGPVYSTWDRPEIGAGIETTSDTTIEGTVNTVIELDDLQNYGIDMETLDENDQPMFDEYGDRIVSPNDKIQGTHEGINYGVNLPDMPGLEPEDYDTSIYKPLCTNIGSEDSIQVEYFPHAAGDYTAPKYSSSKKYYRKVYENKTFSNVTLPKGSHALFKNCTFENVLFVESEDQYYSDSSSTTNNIRFEDCNFNGTIVTDVPKTTTHYSWWMRNVLYFTGEATFNNNSAYPETTVLAPNFNVNLGNTGELDTGGGNVLTGAVVGGIVDIRGNAQIYGTIISMYDTSPFSSGYVTNIGAADDGGSESVGYVGGTIEITPQADQKLPSGISSPIVMEPKFTTYQEVL